LTITGNSQGSTPGRQPSLEFEIPSGAVRVYYVGQKVYKTKNGDKEKVVVHYTRKDGERRKFATDKPAIASDLLELGKMTLPVSATFSWQKGGALTINLE
jgi:hypothetical protein